MAGLCEKVGADVHDVARGVGLDGRIGKKFLHPGPGYGGSCFPKDTSARVKTAQDYGAPLRIIKAVVEVNEKRKRAMADKVMAACGGDVQGKTLAILGLTFKPNTDDMRDAPSLAIIPALQRAGAIVRAYDPEGMHESEKMLFDVTYCADAVVLLMEWNQFRNLDIKRMLTLLKAPIMIDLRNVYSAADVKAAGFSYTCAGRPAA